MCLRISLHQITMVGFCRHFKSPHSFHSITSSHVHYCHCIYHSSHLHVRQLLLLLLIDTIWPTVLVFCNFVCICLKCKGKVQVEHFHVEHLVIIQAVNQYFQLVSSMIWLALFYFVDVQIRLLKNCSTIHSAFWLLIRANNGPFATCVYA